MIPVNFLYLHLITQETKLRTKISKTNSNIFIVYSLHKLECDY